MQAPPNGPTETGFSRDLLGALGAEVSAKVVAAGGDVAMIIDRDGVIRDLAVGNEDLARDGLHDWLDKRWTDTVTLESRHKVEEMLREAAGNGNARWREINHPTPQGSSISVRYLAIDAGQEGRVIAIGRDHRATAELQQRLVQAQQAIERDYARVRDAESRYRLLFQLASEAVIVVDATNRKIVEANPSADRLVGGAGGPLVGRAFSAVFDPGARDAAVSLLAMAQTGARLNTQATLTSAGASFVVSASLFRQDRTSLFLVRLASRDQAAAIRDPNQHLIDMLDRIPDAFVVTDEKLAIVAENNAFLDLTRVPSKEQARGQSLETFLGRPDIDRNILVSSLREHGSIKNFATVLRNTFGGQEDVEVSAVFVPDSSVACYGFTIRSAARGAPVAARAAGDLPRSVEQLSHLVGRVTLKELVRETTDLVERLCIEAALELTSNNRASAAEILGLSRQSLYSKLHRYGLGDFPN
ncbi:MAG: transcriptional regulator PpsR [Phycisphaerales bacterium]|nr:transcriptional regulator PpsR [Hyphomonadaceae bacterium]